VIAVGFSRVPQLDDMRSKMLGSGSQWSGDCATVKLNIAK
jgi:hypothetical protein